MKRIAISVIVVSTCMIGGLVFSMYQSSRCGQKPPNFNQGSVDSSFVCTHELTDSIGGYATEYNPAFVATSIVVAGTIGFAATYSVAKLRTNNH